MHSLPRTFSQVVFGLASPLATVLGNFRSKTRSLLDALRDHLTWTPFMIIFFTGLPMHVLVALLAHPLGINMTWGATLKSLGQSNFFLEIPLLCEWECFTFLPGLTPTAVLITESSSESLTTVKRFWPVFLISTVWLAGIGVLGTSIVPLEWQIMGFFTIWPSIWLTSMHILYPFALVRCLHRLDELVFEPFLWQGRSSLTPLSLLRCRTRHSCASPSERCTWPAPNPNRPSDLSRLPSDSAFASHTSSLLRLLSSFHTRGPATYLLMAGTTNSQVSGSKGGPRGRASPPLT